jgi:hypothetical protein
MDPWLQFGLNILSGLFIAVVTSVVSVSLSLRRFYSQRWWERKAEAYSEIMDSLYHMKWKLEINFDEAAMQKQAPKKTQEYVNGLYTEATQRLQKAESFGTFIISERAVESLVKMRKQLGINRRSLNDYFGHVNSDLGAVNECLTEMREAAKEDLQPRLSWSSWWGR